MTRWIAAPFCALLLTFTANAQQQNKKIYVAGTGCVDCFNFAAPLVNDATTVTPAQIGQIVFDTSDGEFKGHDDTGTWQTLKKDVTDDFISQISSEFAFSTSGYVAGEWGQMSGNSITLTPGTWLISGTAALRDGDATGVSNVTLDWSIENGTNSTTNPTRIDATHGLEAGDRRTRFGIANGSELNDFNAALSPIRMTVTSNFTMYLVPILNFNTTGTTGGLTTKIYAQRIK